MTDGALTLSQASADKKGAAIFARFNGGVGYGAAALPPSSSAAQTQPAAAVAETETGLIINEIAAKGDPLDWFELHNASDSPISLADFVFADDLSDASKRVPFPPDA